MTKIIHRSPFNRQPFIRYGGMYGSCLAPCFIFFYYWSLYSLYQLLLLTWWAGRACLKFVLFFVIMVQGKKAEETTKIDPAPPSRAPRRTQAKARHYVEQMSEESEEEIAQNFPVHQKNVRQKSRPSQETEEEPKEKENPVEKKAAEKKPNKNRVNHPMMTVEVRGKRLAPSRHAPAEGWNRKIPQCAHPMGRLTLRENQYLKWVTCLDCGARWEQLSVELRR